MAGYEDREVAAGAEAPGRARGTGCPGERREFAVGDDLTARNRPEGTCAAAEEVRLVVQVDRHIFERDLLAREVRLQHAYDFREEVSISV
jgi:hypothetical protein